LELLLPLPPFTCRRSNPSRPVRFLILVVTQLLRYVVCLAALLCFFDCCIYFVYCIYVILWNEGRNHSINFVLVLSTSQLTASHLLN
jgi:hypothetical protein